MSGIPMFGRTMSLLISLAEKTVFSQEPPVSLSQTVDSLIFRQLSNSMRPFLPVCLMRSRLLVRCLLASLIVNSRLGFSNPILLTVTGPRAFL
jgi:hypothetical protein